MKNLLYHFLDMLLSLENGIVGRKKWLHRILEKESTQLITILIYYAFIFLLTSFTLLSIDVPIYVNIILIIVFVFIVLKTLMIWRAKQNGRVVTNSKKKGKLNSFNLSISNSILEKLYFNLCRYNVLNEFEVKESSFLKIFLEDFKNHSEVIDFQIELAQVKYLFEKLIKTDSLIKSNRFTSGFRTLKYSDFEKSKKFKYKGEFITSKQLSDNYNKAKKNNPAKFLEFQKLMDKIFKQSLDI